MRAVLATLAALAAPPAVAQDLDLFTLGAGDVGGGYYAAASAICDTVNLAERGRLRCSPEATPGSLYNLAALRDGQIDFALVQSDLHRAAFEGADIFAEPGPMEDLRSIMSLYPEALTVLARADAGVTTIGDIAGKRVDVGPPASGRRATVDRLFRALGLGRADFAAQLELPTGAAIDELCAGRIDVTILIVGHPNTAIGTALADCDARLVPVAGEGVDGALGESGDYVRAVIPRAAYPTLTADVPSFAVTATLVTRAGTEPQLVETLVLDTLASLPVLAIRAPVLRELEPEAMQERGLTAPLHDGAAAAYAAFSPGAAE
jgi:TRAP transporter TAXI family solute receptor